MPKPINIAIYPNSFQFESRILKETKSVVELGLVSKVLIFGTHAPGLPEEQVIDAQRTVMRIRLYSSRFPRMLLLEIIKFLEFSARTLTHSWNIRPGIVSCHSLSVLPIGVALKLLRGMRLVYDTHELETERTALHGARKLFSKLVERLLIPFVDHTVVTSPGYARWYRKAYKRSDVTVFLNTPAVAPAPTAEDRMRLRREFNIPAQDLVFLYHGLLGQGRGLDFVLETFSKASAHQHLAVVGYGPMEGQVRKFAERHPHIHFRPAVPPDEIVRYASGADVGLCLIENLSLSYYHSVPNKLFEYIHAGLGVIVSNFECMSQVVKDGDFGWIVEPNAPALKKLLGSLTREIIQVKKINAMQLRASYCWSHHHPEIQRIYGPHANERPDELSLTNAA